MDSKLTYCAAFIEDVEDGVEPYMCGHPFERHEISDESPWMNHCYDCDEIYPDADLDGHFPCIHRYESPYATIGNAS